MSKYLLDTNVVSELRKPKPHGAVIAWIGGLRDDQLYISAVTIGELQRGIERTRRQDTQKALEINNWVDQLEMPKNVLAMDSLCFREWARLMEGKSDQLLEDAMIVATLFWCTGYLGRVGPGRNSLVYSPERVVRRMRGTSLSSEKRHKA